MNAKRILVPVMLLAMLVCIFNVQAFAAEEPVTVYVTIANGSLVMTQEPVTVTDIDKDGSLTINDALYLAHEAKYQGGAAAGYGSAVGQYGLSLTKLWGVENGGSYGYYVNNVSAMGLTDTVKSGDHINAFVYSDTTAFSDKYCFFDVNTVAETQGKDFTLTLSASGYDENWAPVVTPVADATILVDGVETSYKTDAEGKVTVKIDTVKNCVISAKSDSATLVPPSCIAKITGRANVYVTIVNGSLVMTQEPVTVTDIDKDGALTINDALYLAHEAKYQGGAAAGYGSAVSQYGFGLTKLWGVENGGSYSYYLNNASVTGLADTVKEGDYINAFVFSDTDTFSDKYCYFNAMSLSATEGKEFTLTLSAAGYDENWAPTVSPVADATILIDGVETSYKTDAEGKVTMKIDAVKNCVISAKSSAATLVPPACVVSVTADNTPSGNTALYIIIAAAALLAVAAVVFTVVTRKKKV